MELKDFLPLYKELYKENPSKLSPFAYWKMERLFEEASITYNKEKNIYYLVRNNHLICYLSNDNKMHLPLDKVNDFDCITIEKSVYDLVEDSLEGFNKAVIEPLYYNMDYKIEAKLDERFEVLDFNPLAKEHYIMAAEIINEDLGDYFTEDNIRKMTTFPSYDKDLWFFIREKDTGKLAGISISTFSDEVKEVDIDWMYIRTAYHKQGIGRYMIYETVKRSDKAEIIRVSGVNEFYKKCGFEPKELWAWAAKPGYSFYSPSIQPNILE